MGTEETGRRWDSGVKAADGAKPLKRAQIRIDDESEAILAAIGGGEHGNLSLGIREAARRLVEHNDVGPFNPVRHAARAKQE